MSKVNLKGGDPKAKRSTSKTQVEVPHGKKDVKKDDHKGKPDPKVKDSKSKEKITAQSQQSLAAPNLKSKTKIQAKEDDSPNLHGDSPDNTHAQDTLSPSLSEKIVSPDVDSPVEDLTDQDQPNEEKGKNKIKTKSPKDEDSVAKDDADMYKKSQEGSDSQYQMYDDDAVDELEMKKSRSRSSSKEEQDMKSAKNGKQDREEKKDLQKSDSKAKKSWQSQDEGYRKQKSREAVDQMCDDTQDQKRDKSWHKQNRDVKKEKSWDNQDYDSKKAKKYESQDRDSKKDKQNKDRGVKNKMSWETQECDYNKDKPSQPLDRSYDKDKWQSRDRNGDREKSWDAQGSDNTREKKWQTKKYHDSRREKSYLKQDDDSEKTKYSRSDQFKQEQYSCDHKCYDFDDNQEYRKKKRWDSRDSDDKKKSWRKDSEEFGKASWLGEKSKNDTAWKSQTEYRKRKDRSWESDSHRYDVDDCTTFGNEFAKHTNYSKMETSWKPKDCHHSSDRPTSSCVVDFKKNIPTCPLASPSSPTNEIYPFCSKDEPFYKDRPVAIKCTCRWPDRIASADRRKHQDRNDFLPCKLKQSGRCCKETTEMSPPKRACHFSNNEEYSLQRPHTSSCYQKNSVNACQKKKIYQSCNIKREPLQSNCYSSEKQMPCLPRRLCCSVCKADSSVRKPNEGCCKQSEQSSYRCGNRIMDYQQDAARPACFNYAPVNTQHNQCVKDYGGRDVAQNSACCTRRRTISCSDLARNFNDYCGCAKNNSLNKITERKNVRT